jgi:hypothetical protein
MVNNFHAERPAMTTVYFEERTHLNHHTQLFTPKIQGIKKKNLGQNIQKYKEKL